MEDRDFATYRQRVIDKLTEIDRTIIPSSWWDTVIRHYYLQGLSPDRTVRIVLETLKKA